MDSGLSWVLKLAAKRKAFFFFSSRVSNISCAARINAHQIVRQNVRKKKHEGCLECMLACLKLAFKFKDAKNEAEIV